VAKIVSTLPSKRETKQKLSIVQTELKALRDEEVRRDAELEIREKQFQLLLQSIFDLKSTLMEDEEDDVVILEDQESLSAERQEEQNRTDGNSKATGVDVEAMDTSTE